MSTVFILAADLFHLISSTDRMVADLFYQQNGGKMLEGEEKNQFWCRFKMERINTVFKN